MKTLFKTFMKSIYDPSFYKKVAYAPLSHAIKFYFKVALVLTVVMTVYLGATLIPRGVLFVKKYAPEMVKNYFPAPLTIHIEKGEATVNVPEPYIVSAKDDAQTLLREQGLENMLVIDTKTDFDKKKFEEYKTFALLTRNEIVTQSSKGQITIQDLRGLPILDINQALLLSWIEKIQNSLGLIIFLGIIGTFIAVFLGYLKYLVVLLLFSLIPVLVGYIKKTPLSYSGAYKISLYAIIPGLALITLLNVVGVFFIPAYLTFLAYMLIIAVNMREQKRPELFTN